MEYAFTFTTDTNKKLRKVLFEVKIAVGISKKQIPALVLEGLYFNLLLDELD